MKNQKPGSGRLLRRDFLKAAPIAIGTIAEAARAAVKPRPSVSISSVEETFPAAGHAAPSLTTSLPQSKIQAFDYTGVTLRESRWKDEAQRARDYYLGVSNDDILQGFRARAGLPAPGKPLGGWCAKDSQVVFGQWLSGMSRLYRATNDADLRDKASYLLTEWGKTIPPNGDCGMRHYSWDKTLCGLVDLQLYANNSDAAPLMERILDWGRKNLEHDNMIVVPHHNTLYYGKPQEWYTLSENIFRAYQLTGEPKYKSFGEIWLYLSYWNKFANSASPVDAQGVHAYSHVNTFSSAAMAYAVTADPAYQQIIRNAYDFLQNTQCYATGGYGPNERFMSSNGSLGKALETRSDTFETMCGSWAGFKLSRYLMQFTGESRYGDWIERLFYNGAGAALSLRPGGRNFYYSDYRISGGMKVDYWDNYTCCSGTLFQDMADYHNLIYYKDDASLYVNLYVPSDVVWNRPEGDVYLTQETGYPETETSTMTLAMKQPANFSAKLRVPAWSSDMSVKVNGADAGIACKPGEWAAITREWKRGDKIEVQIPLRLRTEAVDKWHPERVAVVRGPVVLALDYNYHDAAFQFPPDDEALNKWLVPENSPVVFRVAPPDGRAVRLHFRPFYEFAEDFPYLMYFDRKDAPYALW